MSRGYYGKLSSDENDVTDSAETIGPFEYFDYEDKSKPAIDVITVKEKPKSQKIAKLIPVKVDFFNDEYEYDVVEIPIMTDFKKLVLKCFNCTIIMDNNKLICSNYMLADLIGDELKIWTVDFLEKRKNSEDIDSEVLGYTIKNFEEKFLTVKQKIKMKSININFDNISHLDVCGDFSKIIFNNNILDKKKIGIKARHYNILVIGNIDKSNINFDVEQSDIISRYH